jgi:hypothetical protein
MARPRLALAALALLSLVVASDHAPARADEPTVVAPALRRSLDDPPAARGGASLEDPVSAQGRTARGLYFSGPFVRRHGVEGMLAALRPGRMNAAVIDVKDGQGRVLFDSQIPLLADSRVPMLGDARALVARLKSEGVYTIARLVCFDDPILPRAHPDRAVLDGRRNRQGRPWISWGTGNTWLDPSNPENHALVRDLAVEIAALGFDEIQLDYVRFPVDQGTSYAVFPHTREGTRHWEYIASMLRQIDEALRIPLGVDIFGISALRVGDPAGLGQSAEDWAPYVEVFTPMLYANGFKSWTPTGDTERGASFVFAATQRLRERVGAAHVIRPFLQGFAAGADRFDEAFVTGQIRAARHAGANGFLFWNPASNFGTVGRAMRGPARFLAPFPEDIAARVAAER